MDISRHAAYIAGKEWADENLDSLRERYTGTTMWTDEMRKHLWDVALARYPSDPDRMESDVAQTAFVAGALRRVTDTLADDPRSLAEVFDVALELGTTFSVEVAKMECLEELRDKGRSWWQSKKGDLAPDAILTVMSLRFAREHRRMARSRFEPLKEYFGSRELCILAALEKIEVIRDRHYIHAIVESDESTFDVMLNDAGAQKAGEIVG